MLRVALLLTLVALAASASAQDASLAITPVTVVDVTDGTFHSDQTVLIEGRRIAAVGSVDEVAVPDDAETVDAEGGYLIPGLWDMHVHTFNNNDPQPPNTWTFPLYLAHGVTGVRDMFVKPGEQAEQVHAQDDDTHLILAGKLLDVENGVLISNALVRVEDGVIQEVVTGAERNDYEDIIDLSGYTVLPGLMDAHAHLCDNTYMGEDFDFWSYPAATFGIVGTVNARITLEAGFTTVRDVSEPFYADVALRDAINKGWIIGPRMYVSGPMITMSGGHGNWGNWIAHQHKVTTDADAVADGTDEVRKATRIHIKYGVDLIKIAATGGFGSHGTIPGAASYTVEEMQAAVEEARKQGLKVAAHAHGAEGIKNAIQAGVHSIEHGALLDQEAIDLMKEKEVFLVMDVLAAHYDLIEKNKDFSDKELGHSNEQEYASYLQRFRQAYRAGVKMAFGTDASVYPHGRNAEQFLLMVDAGMTPGDAIRSATIWAAELIGIENQAGSIEAGKWADLIAVKGNPLEDIAVLEEVAFVMKGGTVYKGIE